MRRYLVVANQTLLSDQLMQELLLRAEADESSFYVIVPDTARRDYSDTWDAHQSSARQRLNRALSEIRLAGASALGSVEQPDPIEAVSTRLRREEYDEVIVSTLPKTLSRWLKMDLPSKIERAVSMPVTTIIAKED
ncbi:MAG: hypothetical protein QNJ77_15505 [Acidimicrobiia bacterium]|nr:hypothetical protein [Acidimicrobiia bacterium]